MRKNPEAPQAAPKPQTSIKLPPHVAAQLEATLARVIADRAKNGQWRLRITKGELIEMALVQMNASLDVEASRLVALAKAAKKKRVA